MKFRWQTTVWLLIGMLVTNGCKKLNQETNRKLKNLEDLASVGGAEPELCDNQDKRIDPVAYQARVEQINVWLDSADVWQGGNEIQQQVLAETLALAPVPLVQLAEKFKTRFIVSNTPPDSRCRQDMNYGNRPATSCMSATENGSPHIYFWERDAATPKKIENSIRSETMRLLALIYTQYTRTRLEAWIQTLENLSESKKTEEVKSQKAKLEMAYATMLMVKNELSFNFMQDLRKHQKSAYESLTRLRQEFDKRDVHLFSDFVFAETVDSYYCNASTRKSLQDRYTNTHKAFSIFVKSNFEDSDEG